MLHLLIISMILAGLQLQVPNVAIALIMLIVTILQLYKTTKEESRYKYPFKLEGKWWSRNDCVQVTGAGVISISSADILKTEGAKRQLHMLKKLKDMGLVENKDEDYFRLR